MSTETTQDLATIVAENERLRNRNVKLTAAAQEAFELLSKENVIIEGTYVLEDDKPVHHVIGVLRDALGLSPVAETKEAPDAGPTV